ncbi:MAG: helix-turn-helix transcriptional regulator [Clostridia bacterium]|nr:helix-turn-helix transcriptional regulator [Clostridia bacterium]
MTVGEKIQHHRKKQNLSQEELGQKLLVSRQTVSLWEMDKTLPTVDNLIRLKEIFGVSIDELLTEDEPREEEKEAPAPSSEESYQFMFSPQEVKEFTRTQTRSILKSVISLAVITVALTIILAFLDASEGAVCVIVGILVFGMITYVKTFFAYRRAWRTKESRIATSCYTYEVFDDYLTIRISNEKETTKTLKVYFREIEALRDSKRFYIMQIAGQLYFLRKTDLCEDSFFHKRFKTVQNKSVSTKDSKSWSTISLVLFLLSIASIWLALLTVAALIGLNHLAMPENMWAFFLFTPIPLGSIVVGFILKKKGIKYMKNIVVGIIMTALLCIYGSFSFGFADLYSHDDGPILQIEQTIGTDIPPHKQITTQDWTKGTQSGGRGNILSVSEVYFDRENARTFEAQLQADSRWLSTIPNELIGMTQGFFDPPKRGFASVYNLTTGELNCLPTENGTYRLINVYYYGDPNYVTNYMRIIEYELTFELPS